MADVPSYKLEFMYKRSVGPVLSTFLTGLRDQRILAIRTQAGRVLCPPLEYDPDSGDENPDDWTDVGPGGVVRGFTWIPEPSERQILDRPFAWALIQLDGADTAIFHAVDAGSPDAVAKGTRVVPRWADERQGHITDIACFVPEGS